jgi:outer membrane protein assembly factor BamB
MVKAVEDALAKKAKPPEPDEKEKPGYGPAVSPPKKCDGEEDRDQRSEVRGQKTGPAGLAPLTSDLCPLTSGPLFAVIPSFVLVGPLAIVAALFPGVFARMAVGMKRWRAFLTVASINSTLALVYWAVLTYRPQWLPPGRWLGVRMVTVYLMAVALVGLLWAGRRYRRMAADEPAVTGIPGRTELLSLLGLTAFAALCTVLTAWYANWEWATTVELPLREFTFIGIALFAATTYAAYRAATKAADGSAPVRLSLSGESVALGVLVLCGLVTVIQMGAQYAPAVATGTQTGDAEAVFGPRLASDPVAIAAYEVEDGKNVPATGRVISNLTADGDRLLFGVEVVDSGRLFCMNRTTGKVEWAFDAPDLRAVYCTPTVAGGKVYCGEGLHEHKGRRLFCLNVADGNPAWKEPFKTGSHTEGAPAVVGGKVYFPAGDDGLYCADAGTGAKLWQFPGGREKGIHIDAPPAVQNGTVFVGSGLYSFVAVALDASTGGEKWRTDLKLRCFGAPLASGSKVFYGVGTGNMGADVFKYDEEGELRDREPAGAVVCLDAATGKEEWRYSLPKSVHTGLAADAFSVYAGCRDGILYAIDRKSGKLRWKAGIGSSVMSAPAVAESGGFPVAVYAVSREGRVFCLNPQTGAELWSWQKPLPGYNWAGREQNNVMCTPLVLTTPTATGSRRTIYVGGMLVDEFNPDKKTVAVFKFEDVIGE